jgi:dolichol-phosphate mannosyltransferase
VYRNRRAQTNCTQVDSDACLSLIRNNWYWRMCSGPSWSGGLVEVLGKLGDRVQVETNRGGRIVSDLEVLQHPLSKWGHSEAPFACDHITNRRSPETPVSLRLRLGPPEAWFNARQQVVVQIARGLTPASCDKWSKYARFAVRIRLCVFAWNQNQPAVGLVFGETGPQSQDRVSWEHVPVPRAVAHPTGPLRVPARAEMGFTQEAPVLSLVVPTFNEAENIESLLRRIRSLLDPRLGSRYEVIVVDDNSPDETWKVAARIQVGYPRLVVLRREQERGLSSAVVRGWQVAGGDILATINADFQHPPELLPKMLELVRAADLVIATRLGAKGSFGEMPWLRRLLSRGARRTGQFLVPQIFNRVSDPLSGFYLLRREAIAGIELRPTGFKTLIEVLARGRVKTIEECAYAMQERRRGTSNVRWRHSVEYLKQLNQLRSHSGARRS